MASTSLGRVLLIGLLLLTPRVVWADAIILAEFRTINGNASALDPNNGTGNTDSYTQAALVGLPFSESDSRTAAFGFALATGSSSQGSTVGPLAFLFQGSAFTGASSDTTVNNAQANSVSSYEVNFQLTEPHTYTFDATLEANSFTATGAFPQGFARLFMFGFGPLHEANLGSGSQVLDFSGTLSPGDYQVAFRAGSLSVAGVSFGPSLAIANATVVGNLTLARSDGNPPIPEPTTLVLVTSGLVGMGVRQWRKRRRQNE